MAKLRDQFEELLQENKASVQRQVSEARSLHHAINDAIKALADDAVGRPRAE